MIRALKEVDPLFWGGLVLAGVVFAGLCVIDAAICASM